MELLIVFVSIFLSSIALYYIIKYAVRNGINESMLASDEQREESDDDTPQKECPQCEKAHDFDYPKCPHCAHEYETLK
ncbi:MAG: DUF6019 family protein [Oscillospiraceae bacterium]|nr:DUF6019 family protein [Oscillospiraceae bacterium]